MLLHLDLKFSFIGIFETWLKDISHTWDKPGYKFIHNHRIDADGGGVGLYLAENFEFFIGGLDSFLVRISKENKACYLMADWNLDLMKHHKHDKTSEFLDVLTRFLSFDLATD